MYVINLIAVLCLGTYQYYGIVTSRMQHNQAIQHWVLLVDSHDEGPQILNGHSKVDTAHRRAKTIHSSSSATISWIPWVVIFTYKISNERKGERIRTESASMSATSVQCVQTGQRPK